MANNSIEYKTAKHIADALADMRLNEWSLAQALEVHDMPVPIVKKLIIPFIGLTAVQHEFRVYAKTSDHAAVMRWCYQANNLAIAENLTAHTQLSEW
jgi:hypothetical protein